MTSSLCDTKSTAAGPREISSLVIFLCIVFIDVPLEFCLLSFFLLSKTQFRLVSAITGLLFRSGEGKFRPKKLAFVTEEGDETGVEPAEEVDDAVS